MRIGAQKLKLFTENKTSVLLSILIFWHGPCFHNGVINLGEFMVQEARCVNCGFNIEKDYILFINGTEFTFDSFECAVNFVAPRCANCNSIIMGRGIQQSGDMFCCSTCSKEGIHSAVVP